MAVQALIDAYAYVGGYDFTTDTNQATLGVSVAELDSTTFGSDGWREVTGGLSSVTFDMAGFWQSAADQAVDPQAFPALGTVDQVFTVGEDSTAGTSPLSGLGPPRAFMFQAGKFSYQLLGEVGQLAPFNLSSAGTDGVGVKNGVLVAPKGDVSATGQLGGTFDTLGFGVGASQSIWCTFHVFTAGTTITVDVESDDNTGFTTPTTQATIGPLTTTGGTWMTPVAGPLTDRYYRLNVSAVTGTFTVAAALAVAS